MIQQTFTAANHEELVAEIAAYLRAENYYVVHNSKLPSGKVSFREVAEKYKLKASTLSHRLSRFKGHFPHERGKEGVKIVWMIVTPELHDHLRKPIQCPPVKSQAPVS